MAGTYWSIFMKSILRFVLKLVVLRLLDLLRELWKHWC